MMPALGNFLWHFPLLGFVSAVFFWLLGVLLTVTAVAAPVGSGLMELGKFLLAPLGHEMVTKPDLTAAQNPVWRALSLVVMVVYFPFGLVFFVLLTIQTAWLSVTIAGLPVALVGAKSLGTAIHPANRVRLTTAMAEEVRRHVAVTVRLETRA